ncbi:hypothetical protein Pmani_025430 [Petrolisthes manimaculis]|uniref:Uncharacterized protein n=1 Tax=Petrolisthes manimaculis TaxID=1843537 RepID=A0AAE1P6P9_9EUCA|nr:hypothetical protein Pmani_025430 [Petrolisthes manimaculis]
MESANKKTAFRAASEIMTEFMDKGEAVSLAIAECVSKALYKKTILSKHLVDYAPEGLEACDKSCSGASCLLHKRIKPCLRLKCSACGKFYKGSWFSPSKSSRCTLSIIHSRGLSIAFQFL